MFNVFEFEKRVNQSQKEIQRSQSDARHRQHAKCKLIDSLVKALMASVFSRTIRVLLSSHVYFDNPFLCL